MTRQPAMEWQADKGYWRLRTEYPLSNRHVQACIDFTIKVQKARRLGLNPGDIRDDLDASIKALEQKQVRQWAAGPHMDGTGEIEVFRATEGTGKTIFLGA